MHFCKRASCHIALPRGFFKTEANPFSITATMTRALPANNSTSAGQASCLPFCLTSFLARSMRRKDARVRRANSDHFHVCCLVGVLGSGFYLCFGLLVSCVLGSARTIAKHVFVKINKTTIRRDPNTKHACCLLALVTNHFPFTTKPPQAISSHVPDCVALSKLKMVPTFTADNKTTSTTHL